MYGSNLSTVFADSPPPLDENADIDDHGEFVFSAETNAIGEAVLNKIEGKLQKDAERPKEIDNSNFGDLNKAIDSKKPKYSQNSEDFEDFPDLKSSNSNSDFAKFDDAIMVNPVSPTEINGGSISSGKDDDGFADFSSSNDIGTSEDTGWCAFSSPSNEDTKNDKNWSNTQASPGSNPIWRSSKLPSDSENLSDFSNRAKNGLGEKDESERKLRWDFTGFRIW